MLFNYLVYDRDLLTYFLAFKTNIYACTSDTRTLKLPCLSEVDMKISPSAFETSLFLLPFDHRFFWTFSIPHETSNFTLNITLLSNPLCADSSTHWTTAWPRIKYHVSMAYMIICSMIKQFFFCILSIISHIGLYILEKSCNSMWFLVSLVDIHSQHEPSIWEEWAMWSHWEFLNYP